MSIGDVLATAREAAGLTVTQVSDLTRIRASIIADLERDDFGSCGGDFYARGHLRAVAQAIGIDAAPLIEEFDAARRAEQAAEPDLGSPALLRPRLTRADWSGQPGRPGRSRRRGINWSGVLAVLVVIAVGFAGYLLVSGGGGSGNSGPDAAGRTHHGAGHGHDAGPSPTASAPAPVVTRVRMLQVASAAAFGPAGAGTGDDPGDAGLAIDGDASTAWHTDWYATAEFGALQAGTGLLLDLGKPVTITAARLALGAASGARVQLRAGDSATPSALRPVAQATGSGAALTLTASHAVRARYVLIWFTRLPQDSAGTFMASLYSVRIDGRLNGSGGDSG